ncbi:MAG TPA: shikimate kinase [Byssovorax sp.]|jgi:XRE family aerobic/anaerobic benzoate catabolism transcriptional regulator
MPRRHPHQVPDFETEQPPMGTPLLDRIASRVRGRREELAMPLRMLAELSTVSERYLVMVEKGEANVSVIKLDAIARALDASAADLLSDAPMGAPRGTPGTRDVIALLGLRGAGKTSIGERAASRLGRPFVELDARVAARAGMSLGELFELHGVDYYKRLEREELENLLGAGREVVIATGGSVVTDHATYEILRRYCQTIWLKAKPEDHMNRVVAQGDARPMANRRDAMRELKALLRARRALYERADFVVDTSALGFERSVDEVVRIARDPRRARSKTRDP